MSSPHTPSPDGGPWLICPYCGQDYVWEVLLTELDQQALMCPECDTVWLASGDVLNGTGQNFQDFMAARGRKANWGGVVRLQKAVGKPS
jgi:hypothetical protein